MFQVMLPYFRPLVLLLVCGCASKSNMPAWGEVTYGGLPVEEGTIEFIPIERTSGPPVETTIKEGAYEITRKAGLLSGGSYKVSICAIRRSGKFSRYYFGKGVPPLEVLENYIPETYNRRTTLQIQISSKKSENEYNFSLEKASKKIR